MSANVRDIIKSLEEFAATLPEATGDQELAKAATVEMQAFFADLRKAVADMKATQAATSAVQNEAETRTAAAEAVTEPAVRKGEDTFDISEALQKALAPYLDRLAAIEAAVAASSPASEAVVEKAEGSEKTADTFAKSASQADVEAQVRVQVAEQLRRIGFTPSVPAVQSLALGYEQSGMLGKGIPGSFDAQKVTQTYEYMKQIQNLPFSAINRLRTQANAW